MLEGEQLLTPERQSRAEEILRAASMLSGDSRSSFVERETGDDDVLRMHVLERLERLEQTRTVPTDGAASTPPGSSSSSGGGGRSTRASLGANVPAIPGFQINSLLSDAGGMGLVYLATQNTTSQPVALKVMKKHLATEAARVRFEREARLLGQLSHPGIARVIESGAFSEGPGADAEPYFAMEYIANARSLTTYVRERELGERSILELFVKVCHAIEHGHQNGVIHRDLKPSNILITETGEPKVIDFGIARAVDVESAEGTGALTSMSTIMGTPQYMSPEQCSGRAFADTRSDVWSLGVLLFEALTGEFVHEFTPGQSVLEKCNLILNTREPRRLRDVDPSRPKNLDLILRKALAYDRQDRLHSVEALRVQLERHLDGLPNTLESPALTTLIGVTVRKHPTTVSMLSLAFVGAIVIAAIASALNAQTTDANRRLADQIAVTEESNATLRRMLDQMIDMELENVDTLARIGQLKFGSVEDREEALRAVDRRMLDVQTLTEDLFGDAYPKVTLAQAILARRRASVAWSTRNAHLNDIVTSVRLNEEAARLFERLDEADHFEPGSDAWNTLQTGWFTALLERADAARHQGREDEPAFAELREQMSVISQRLLERAENRSHIRPIAVALFESGDDAIAAAKGRLGEADKLIEAVERKIESATSDDEAEMFRAELDTLRATTVRALYGEAWQSLDTARSHFLESKALRERPADASSDAAERTRDLSKVNFKLGRVSELYGQIAMQDRPEGRQSPRQYFDDAGFYYGLMHDQRTQLLEDDPVSEQARRNYALGLRQLGSYHNSVAKLYASQKNDGEAAREWQRCYEAFAASEREFRRLYESAPNDGRSREDFAVAMATAAMARDRCGEGCMATDEERAAQRQLISEARDLWLRIGDQAEAGGDDELAADARAWRDLLSKLAGDPGDETADVSGTSP